MIRGRLPYSLASYITTSCEESTTTDTQELRDCVKPKDTHDLATIAAELQRDRTVLRVLRTHMSQLRVQIEILGELSEEGRELIEHLGDL